MKLVSRMVLKLCLLAVLAQAGVVAEEFKSIFLAIQFQSMNDIPTDCREDLLLPTTPLSGYSVDWEYLCSNSFYDKCEQVLEYIFRLEYTMQEREFITGIIKAVTDLGASFTCNKTEETITEVMENGGQQCISNSMTAIYYCSYVSILRFLSGQYQENVCKALDISYECYMKTISDCNTTALNELWTAYYHHIIQHSPCNKFTQYGGRAVRQHSGPWLIFILAVVIVISNCYDNSPQRALL